MISYYILQAAQQLPRKPLYNSNTASRRVRLLCDEQPTNVIGTGFDEQTHRIPQTDQRAAICLPTEGLLL